MKADISQTVMFANDNLTRKEIKMRHKPDRAEQIKSLNLNIAETQLRLVLKA